MTDAISEATIEVTVLGGYLGAGKTTLLNHILRSTEEPVVVLVNDFGSINIDASLITAVDEHMIALANGCICCSLVDGLAAALEQVRALEPRPARLVVEASGVANPAAIAAYAHGRGLRLDGVITVVDAETIRVHAKDRFVGDTILRQIRSADLLLLNKLDLVDPDAIAGLRSWLTSESNAVPILEAQHGEVALHALLGHTGPRRSAPELGPSADDIFSTWSTTTQQRFDREKLIHMLTSWSKDLIRVKGVVAVAAPSSTTVRVAVQQVGRRCILTDTGPWAGGPSTLMAIGIRSSINADELDRDLASALLPQDIEARPVLHTYADHR